jgi:hypothetical protein
MHSGMKPYYMYVGILLAVSACGSHTPGAQASQQQNLAIGGTDYSYIYTQMAAEGSCRNNMTLGGGLAAKCSQ